jgi:OOP family OmpA-OmpF porin
VFNYVNTKSDAGKGDIKAYLYRLDGLYHFNATERFVPYVAAGVGGIYFDRSGGNDNDPLVNYGGGLKYFITEAIALRGDVRHVISFDSTYNNLLYTVGLSIFFGGTKEAAARAPLDSDGDGVPDHLDRCPDTPAGVAVDSSGCPLDSDGDGVPDYLDRCPDTPAGVAVDSSGCPLDSDGDGVPDYLDKCPGTPIGARVDERGCWVLKDVRFDIGKATIRPESYAILNEVVDIMDKNPELKIEIQGHTDSTGSAELNRMLSQNRAASVLEYFASEGIDRTRLTCRGFGMDNPIASNATADGRAKNRRVELNPIK